jgi:hypothetical protein
MILKDFICKNLNIDLNSGSGYIVYKGERENFGGGFK